MSRTPKTAPNTAFTGRAFVAYYRVSTARQGESGLGLDAQRAAVAKHLATVADSRLVADYFISGLMEAAADFVACDMPHANRLTIHILAAIAENEREMISARTKAALEQVKERGVRLGNPRWAESIATARAARQRPARPADVNALVAGYSKDGVSLRGIAGRLNGLGIKTASGATWYPSSVRSALAAAPKAA